MEKKNEALQHDLQTIHDVTSKSVGIVKPLPLSFPPPSLSQHGQIGDSSWRPQSPLFRNQRALSPVYMSQPLQGQKLDIEYPFRESLSRRPRHNQQAAEEDKATDTSEEDPELRSRSNQALS